MREQRDFQISAKYFKSPLKTLWNLASYLTYLIELAFKDLSTFNKSNSLISKNEILDLLNVFHTLYVLDKKQNKTKQNETKQNKTKKQTNKQTKQKQKQKNKTKKNPFFLAVLFTNVYNNIPEDS